MIDVELKTFVIFPVIILMIIYNINIILFAIWYLVYLMLDNRPP